MTAAAIAIRVHTVGTETALVVRNETVSAILNPAPDKRVINSPDTPSAVRQVELNFFNRVNGSASSAPTNGESGLQARAMKRIH